MEKALGSTTFPQRALNVRAQHSGKQTTDPLKMQEHFGDKSLKDVLNSVADPNYKANPRKVRGVGSDKLDKDAFFKLMLTQLKQQDPTNPLKSHEMAAQLAQFSSVEQLTNMNSTLQAMSEKDNQNGRYDVLGLIGKKVSGDSGQIDRMKGDKDHKIEFNLSEGADQVKVAIKDSRGQVVKKYELSDLKKGKNQLVWNGLHGDGSDAKVGQFTAHITATNQGRKIPVSTQFSGAVDGVQFSAEGPVLMVGGKTLKLQDVKTISEAEEKKPVAQNLIKPDQKVSEGAKVAAPSVANLDTAQMDKELRQKLTK